MNDKPNDLEEQYLLLEEEEEKEKKRRIIILVILFILILIVAFVGATFSYYRYKHHHGGGHTETCTVNCDTNSDGIPDINIDYEGDNHSHFNVDQDGNGTADFNLMNQDTNNDGVCDLNCDTDSDGHPDYNIDLDGDGIADVNIKDEDGNITNIDKDGDGVCDEACNGIMTEVADSDDNVVLTIDYQDQTVYYIGRTITYAVDNIRPGWKDVIEFKIKNNTSSNSYFQIDWVDVLNNITEVNNITYRISKDNMLVFDETRAPYESTPILSKVLIPANTTYTYRVEFEFKETWVDQSEDQNKMFMATIKVAATS